MTEVSKDFRCTLHRNFAISDTLLRPKFSILGRISEPNFQIEDVGRFVVSKKGRIPVFHRGYFMGSRFFIVVISWEFIIAEVKRLEGKYFDQLQTIPGIDEISAAIILIEIGRGTKFLEAFKRADSFAAWLGLPFTLKLAQLFEPVTGEP